MNFQHRPGTYRAFHNAQIVDRPIAESLLFDHLIYSNACQTGLKTVTMWSLIHIPHSSSILRCTFRDDSNISVLGDLNKSGEYFQHLF